MPLMAKNLQPIISIICSLRLLAVISGKNHAYWSEGQWAVIAPAYVVCSAPLEFVDFQETILFFPNM